MAKGSLALPCPECGSNQSRVTDSRANETGIRRRRQCINGHRFSTQEILLTEWQTQIEEAVDEAVGAALQAVQNTRDSYRNKNRG